MGSSDAGFARQWAQFSAPRIGIGLKDRPVAREWTIIFGLFHDRFAGVPNDSQGVYRPSHANVAPNQDCQMQPDLNEQ
ncbi:MAG: hypothetical protein IPF49_07425 [Gammaproteobacteria bacterium]|nr:hypothetical protein [Gammaproteobacteria bacterium]